MTSSDDEELASLRAAAASCAAHLKGGEGDLGTKAAFNGLFVRLNVRQAATFLWRLFTLKGKLAAAGADPMKLLALRAETVGVITAGLNMIRVRLNEAAFICFCMLEESPEGVDPALLQGRFEAFIAAALSAGSVERFFSLGVSKSYLERALDQSAHLVGAMRQLEDHDLVERTPQGLLKSKDRDFEWGFTASEA